MGPVATRDWPAMAVSAACAWTEGEARAAAEAARTAGARLLALDRVAEGYADGRDAHAIDAAAKSMANCGAFEAAPSYMLLKVRASCWVPAATLNETHGLMP